MAEQCVQKLFFKRIFNPSSSPVYSSTTISASKALGVVSVAQMVENLPAMPET